MRRAQVKGDHDCIKLTVVCGYPKDSVRGGLRMMTIRFSGYNKAGIHKGRHDACLCVRKKVDDSNTSECKHRSCLNLEDNIC